MAKGRKSARKAAKVDSIPLRRTTRFWAVEVTDPLDGGKTVKYPFAYREHAELWAKEEVQAANELGISGVTTRIFRADGPKEVPGPQEPQSRRVPLVGGGGAMRREWYCRPKGSGNCYGPHEAPNLREARRFWRDFFGTARVEVWETTRAARQAIQENYRKTYHPMYAAE